MVLDGVAYTRKPAAARQAVQQAALRRLGQGEVFAPRFQMDALDSEFPDSMHRKMKYARDYLRILNETGGLTDAKWGVLEEIAESTPGFADRLNLATPSQARVAAVSEGTRTVQGRSLQRMAGSPAVTAAVRQHAAPSSRRLQLTTGSYEIFPRSMRELDFTPIDKPGSQEGVYRGIERISGNWGRKIDSERRDDPQKPYGFGRTIDSYEAMQLVPGLMSGKPIDQFLAGKARVSPRKIGRLPQDKARLIEEYMKAGLHVGPERSMQHAMALSELYELANGKARADKGNDWLEMFGNFMDPYLPEDSVARPEAIYRGDVVPVELVRGTGQRGGLDLYNGRRRGAASYSIEPFQAYRYTMMKRDGRFDRALRDSPSGQVVRRIAQVNLFGRDQVPVINPDYGLQGKSELVYPSANSNKKLVSEFQLFNASEPEIPLIWQVYQ